MSKSGNGYTVYKVDGANTIITSIRDNVARGFILEKNTKLVPCYIAKGNNQFAHGNALHEAFTALQEKLYDDSTEEERIEAFKKKFPQYDTKYNNADLFAYHHVLTGSCRMGRESFVNSKGLTLDGKTTVREFVELTKDAYGGGIIKKLPKEYGITDKQTKNSNNMEDFQKRMLDEHSELKERLTKLNAALSKDGFREKVGDYQYKLMKKQAHGMEEYLSALEGRLVDMGLI